MLFLLNVRVAAQSPPSRPVNLQSRLGRPLKVNSAGVLLVSLGPQNGGACLPKDYTPLYRAVVFNGAFSLELRGEFQIFCLAELTEIMT